MEWFNKWWKIHCHFICFRMLFCGSLGSLLQVIINLQTFQRVVWGQEIGKLREGTVFDCNLITSIWHGIGTCNTTSKYLLNAVVKFNSWLRTSHDQGFLALNYSAWSFLGKRQFNTNHSLGIRKEGARCRRKVLIIILNLKKSSNTSSS